MSHWYCKISTARHNMKPFWTQSTKYFKLWLAAHVLQYQYADNLIIGNYWSFQFELGQNIKYFLGELKSLHTTRILTNEYRFYFIWNAHCSLSFTCKRWQLCFFDKKKTKYIIHWKFNQVVDWNWRSALKCNVPNV